MRPPDRKIRIFAFGNSYRLEAEIAARLEARGRRVEVQEWPNLEIGDCGSRELAELRAALRERPGEITIFLPRNSEFFLPEPSLTLLFSAYASWHDPQRVIVMPHVWPPNLMQESEAAQFLWTEKPTLSVGFAGNGYGASRAARLGGRLPPRAADFFLRGRHLTRPDLVALCVSAGFSCMHVPAFVRRRCLEILEAEPGLDTHIVDNSRHYSGGAGEKDRFRENILESTYILCPRGGENFSYRFFETLSFGRVPVLIDTDIVLPEVDVDWRALCLVVPARELSRLGDVVREDHARDTAHFLQRQRKAIETMNALRTLSWLDGVVERIDDAAGVGNAAAA